VAAELKRKLGISTTLIEGDRGEFTVWVGPTKVAEKKNGEFPTETEVVTVVQARIMNHES
jgi:hypothetical protein